MHAMRASGFTPRDTEARCMPLIRLPVYSRYILSDPPGSVSSRGPADASRVARSDSRGPVVPGAGSRLAGEDVRRPQELFRLQGAVRGGVARGAEPGST